MRVGRCAPLMMLFTIIVVAVACGTEDALDDTHESGLGAVATSPAATEPSAPPTTSAAIDPTPAVSEDAACDGLISSSAVGYASLDEMAWFSHQVVIGTVIEQLPPKKITVKGSVLPFVIVTDARLSVERRFRGQPAESILVRSYGGRIGDCSQEFPDSPRPAVGDHLLLFVRANDAEPQVYDFLGSDQGYWTINASDTVSTTAVHLLPNGKPATLSEIEHTIVRSLADGPPADGPLSDMFLVPADEAPLAPDIVPSPTPSATPAP